MQFNYFHCQPVTDISHSEQEEQTTKDLEKIYQKKQETINNSGQNEKPDEQKKKREQEQSKCFCRPQIKSFKDDQLLNAEITKLSFGIYPYLNDQSQNFSFKPFIYVQCEEEVYNSLLEAGSFNKRDADKDVSEKAHI